MGKSLSPKSPKMYSASFMLRAGMSSLARAMRCSEESSSMSSTIAMLNMLAWKCERFSDGV